MNGPKAEKDKTEKARLGRRTKEEIYRKVKSLRFQTGVRHQKFLASLRGIYSHKKFDHYIVTIVPSQSLCVDKDML